MWLLQLVRAFYVKNATNISLSSSNKANSACNWHHIRSIFELKQNERSKMLLNHFEFDQGLMSDVFKVFSPHTYVENRHNRITAKRHIFVAFVYKTKHRLEGVWFNIRIFDLNFLNFHVICEYKYIEIETNTSKSASREFFMFIGLK